jgi:hypothetical protein
LAIALSDGQMNGLQLMRLTPSEVFVDESGSAALARLLPLSFSYLVENVIDSDKWSEDTGPFTAPEIWDKRLTLLAADAAKDPDLDVRIDQANQFSLGMVIWCMMVGGIEFRRTPGDRPNLTVRKFEEWVLGLPDKILNDPTQSIKRRALARIVERLIRFKREERWGNMGEVRMLLGAFDVDRDKSDLYKLAKEVYQRICVLDDHDTMNRDFYVAFYHNLWAEGAKVSMKERFFERMDMKRQHEILHEALGQLLNYSPFLGGDPTTLTRYIKRHKELGLTREEFRMFGHALIKTFQDGMPIDFTKSKRELCRAAIEVIIWPGIYYFIEKCTSRHKEAGGDRVTALLPRA